MSTSTAPWPPPPDIDSIQELVATADIEGFIADGSPADEYETEAELIFNAVENFPTDDLIPEQILPILEFIWAKSFELKEYEIVTRSAALQGLADQIGRFFGPEAQPQVRGA